MEAGMLSHFGWMNSCIFMEFFVAFIAFFTLILTLLNSLNRCSNRAAYWKVGCPHCSVGIMEFPTKADFILLYQFHMCVLLEKPTEEGWCQFLGQLPSDVRVHLLHAKYCSGSCQRHTCITRWLCKRYQIPNGYLRLQDLSPTKLQGCNLRKSLSAICSILIKITVTDHTFTTTAYGLLIPNCIV